MATRAPVILAIAAHLNGSGITRTQRIAFPDGGAVHLWAFEAHGKERVVAILEKDRAFIQWKVLQRGFWSTVLRYQELALSQAKTPREAPHLRAA
jgi:hypothetical protein